MSKSSRGGDEFSFVIVGRGVTSGTVEAALTSAQKAVQQYVEAHGLSAIPHLKHPEDPTRRGTGIVFGVAAITPATANVDAVISSVLATADHQVEARKAGGYSSRGGE
ncbi:hypothetical protein [Kitasatospora mediocidica]|uniref:hypothetical protein n=1 Tax=Kitasatospora mediocidica TaxID=58352 RepID=UPI0005684873|nr:hypothetical protein [Kitasatospora mediocidica]